MTSFSNLGIRSELLEVLSGLGINTPTDIQQKSIPILIGDKTDFIGLAQTGTGKTAAFGLPLINNLDANANYTQALVLAPTRELGQQIAEQLTNFSKNMRKVNILAVYGGAPIQNQIRALNKTQQIIIATPGRLVDLIKRKSIHLDQLHTVVLDEADEMLDMGFKDDLDFILGKMPASKNTWLFSATMAKEIRRIVSSYMENPKEAKVENKSITNENIDHQVIGVKQSDKVKALTRILDATPALKGLIFCRTRRDTQELTDDLRKQGYKAEALHGDLTQQKRDQVMKRFKQQELDLVVATDVAARGIDVNDLSHVMHFNLPDDVAYYTHRSGRTARAGKSGTSLVFATRAEQGKISRFEKALNIRFSKVELPNVNDVARMKLSHWFDQMQSTEIAFESIAEEVIIELADMSKEDLIKKLVSYELRKLDVRNIQSDDRKSRDDDRGGKAAKVIKINIGNKQGINKDDLLDFLFESTGEGPKAFGMISINGSETTIEVEAKMADLVVAGFRDITVEGKDVTASVISSKRGFTSSDRGGAPRRQGHVHKKGGSGKGRHRYSRR